MGSNSCTRGYAEGAAAKTFPARASRKHVAAQMRKADAYLRGAVLGPAGALRGPSGNKDFERWEELRGAVRGARPVRRPGCAGAVRTPGAAPHVACELRCNGKTRSLKWGQWLPCWCDAHRVATHGASCCVWRRAREWCAGRRTCTIQQAHRGSCRRPAAQQRAQHRTPCGTRQSRTRRVPCTCRGELGFVCEISEGEACAKDVSACQGFSWPAFKSCRGAFSQRKTVTSDTDVRSALALCRLSLHGHRAPWRSNLCAHTLRIVAQHVLVVRSLCA